MSQTIVITGGAGFIGSSLLDVLMKSKTDWVIVIDNLSTGSKENISKWLAASNFSFIYADMLDTSSLVKTIENCDIVFHLAANSTVRLGAIDTKPDYQQNLLLTIYLRQWEKAARARK